MFMKKISSLLLLAGITATLYSQKTINDPNAEKRSVSGYHAILVSHGIDLYLSQGDEETVAVSASDVKYRDRIKTEVVNGVLKIWYDYDRNLKMDWGNKRMKAYVSAKNIDRLEGSGGSDIEIYGTLKASELKLGLSGGSDFEGKVEGSTITVEQSGGSDISISGRVSTLKIDASGGSDFAGYDLISESCEIEASGGSDVTITVNKELNASASGGSDVHYKGNASVKNAKSGGSTIKKVSK
jgi:hypothetical protein